MADEAGGLERMGKDLRVSRLKILAAEPFQADLTQFLRGGGRPQKYRAEIAEARLPAGGTAAQISPADRDRIFRPQAIALAFAGQQKVRFQLFAQEVEEGGARLQNRRLQPRKAGRLKAGERLAPSLDQGDGLIGSVQIHGQPIKTLPFRPRRRGFRGGPIKRRPTMHAI